MRLMPGALTMRPFVEVGGPATANDDWIGESLDFCERNDVPADFLTTHHYPTDAFGRPGDDTSPC